jgi:hypothetical protein
MPRSSRYILAVAGVLGIACQNNTTTVSGSLAPPQHLGYQLDASGDPNAPAGILLVWDDVLSSDLASYGVYSRASTSGSFQLRGETSSNTFHDNGVPHLQYAVTAVDVNGGESDFSNIVTVNEYLQTGAPSALVGISLDSAIHLGWQDTPNLSRLKWYRVYSSDYVSGSNPCTNWVLEGTTVSHEFLAAQIPNGVTRCFDVSAVDTLGYESLGAGVWTDTPRPDARNVLVWAVGVNTPAAGFRFWNDANGNQYGDPGELGLVQAGNRTDIDFSVFVNPGDSTLWFVPVFAGDSLLLYSNSPVPDLTAIDLAPATGYSRDTIQAVPGYGYVFQRNEAGAYHYAALRVTAVSRQYVIFDWSVQTDPGNPELAPKPRSTARQVAVSR